MIKYEIQKKLSEISLISIMVYKIFFVILLCIFIYILFYVTILLFRPKNNKYCLMLNKDKIDIIKSLMRVSWFFIVISIFYWLVQSKTFKFKDPEIGIKTTITYLLIPLLCSYTLWQFENFNFMECNFNQTLDTEYCLNIDATTLYYWKITLVTIWILFIILSYFYIKDIFNTENCKERVAYYENCKPSNNVNKNIEEEEERLRDSDDSNPLKQLFGNDDNDANDAKILKQKIKLNELIDKYKNIEKDRRVLVDPVPSGPRAIAIEMELKRILEELNQIPTPIPPEPVLIQPPEPILVQPPRPAYEGFQNKLRKRTGERTTIRNLLPVKPDDTITEEKIKFTPTEKPSVDGPAKPSTSTFPGFGYLTPPYRTRKVVKKHGESKSDVDESDSKSVGDEKEVQIVSVNTTPSSRPTPNSRIVSVYTTPNGPIVDEEDPFEDHREFVNARSGIPSTPIVDNPPSRQAFKGNVIKLRKRTGDTITEEKNEGIPTTPDKRGIDSFNTTPGGIVSSPKSNIVIIKEDKYSCIDNKCIADEKGIYTDIYSCAKECKNEDLKKEIKDFNKNKVNTSKSIPDTKPSSGATVMSPTRPRVTSFGGASSTDILPVSGASSETKRDMVILSPPRTSSKSESTLLKPASKKPNISPLLPKRRIPPIEPNATPLKEDEITSAVATPLREDEITSAGATPLREDDWSGYL
jgi:hypothetical protein